MFTLIITLITYLFLQLRTSAVIKGARGGAVGEEGRVTQGTAGGGRGGCCVLVVRVHLGEGGGGLLPTYFSI